MSDTIFALSTAAGRAGVAMIRVSGVDALLSVQKLTDQKDIKPRQAYFSILKDPRNGQVIDHGVVTYFKSPNSFTGENIVEYAVHGSPAVVKCMIDVLGTLKGYRLAEAGEFTKRGFINGKFDLTEAEAIADLIHAETDIQRQQALSQLEGKLSSLYQDWTERLKRVLAHQEADIEFPEEDMPDGVSDAMSVPLKQLLSEISEHLNDNRRGERLRDGISITIFGAPNAGKSSLMNVLAKRDVAIVSDQAGTTRDVIEVSLDLGGYPVILSDTAGLRQGNAENKIEEEGINRAHLALNRSDFKIALFDANVEPDQETLDVIDKDTLVVLNKVDITKPEIQTIKDHTPVLLSAKTEEGLVAFLERLTTEIQQRYETRNNQPSLTRERHRTALMECHEACLRSFETDLPELAAEDIRIAIRALGRITGRVDVEDLLDVIFRDFCIGK